MKITTHSGNPDQYVGPVEEYNVDILHLNGASRIKHDQTTFIDVDETVTERIQQQATNQIKQQQSKSEQAELDRQADFDDLFPSEKRLALERYWTPIIQKLASQHESHCDAVTEFEDDQMRYRADIQAKFAYELQHPDVKTVTCNGEQHFNYMINSGSLNISGYKLVERRSMGGQMLMVNGAQVSTPGTSQLVYIPLNVNNLMDYAQSPEALKVSQQQYAHQLQRLIQKRKQAAVALTEAKQTARDQLAAIPTFEQLISDAVKRATRK